VIHLRVVFSLQTLLALLLGAVALTAGLLPAGLRAIALYPALGVFPGMLLAQFLARRESALHRWVVGLALSPLAAALAGWILLSLGGALPAAARAIAAVSWAGWLAATFVRPPAPESAPGSSPRGWLPWALGFAGLVALLPALNPWLLVHFDGWFHAGLVWEIVQHGIPPESPNFAGPPSSYMWIYHVFIALLVVLGSDPFLAMAALNVADAFVLVALVHRLGRLLWRDERAATGAVALTLLGLNAGAWLLWPLWLVRALSGKVVGGEEVLRQLHTIHPLSDLVILSLSAPYAVMLSLLDKFAEGTALNYAWVLLLLALWGALDWLGGGRRASLALVALATCGVFLFHGVVAFSAIPVLLLTLLAMWLLRARWTWLPGRGRLTALAAALAAGAILGLPYLLRLSRGWASPGAGLGGSPLRFGWVMPWTIVTSLAVVLWVAREPLRRAFRERLPGPATVALYALAMTCFTLVVHLPVLNESKFVFQIFFLMALVGGAAFHPWLGGLTARHGRAWTAVVFTLLFLVGPALTVVGYVADPAGHTDPRAAPSAAERGVYRWIRERTETNAVFLDARQRDLVMVHGRRRLYLGTATGTEQFAFPLEETRRRLAVMADLYGECRDAAGDAGALRELGRPVYVIVRPEDAAANAGLCLARHPGLFTEALRQGGYRVYRLRER
jgi:hypothetical protein